ncbi:MAG: hypothetical protein KAY24_09415 [Candidatus Eisenbacteria sp.]|nr:hypothetical protein [Candidatus Eisenbacteria bacterium]
MFLLVLLPSRTPGADLVWTDDDWSGSNYASTDGIDAEVHPGLLVLESELDDIRLVGSPTEFQGIYSLATYHDTLFLAASDYPYMYEGADVLTYDYMTDAFALAYQPYESGLHAIKVFGDTLYIPGPDSMDPWVEGGSIYTYDGHAWIEKDNLPRAVHVCDVEVMNDMIFVTTGQLCADGYVLVSHDWGDSFTVVFTLEANHPGGWRRLYGAGQHGGRVYFQPDGQEPQSNVVYATTDGTEWDTLSVPNMPVEKQAMFTAWGDSLLMTIGNRLYIYDGGEEWHQYCLPFQGWRWCRGIHIYKGDLYGGGDDCRIHRWLQGSQWELVAEMGVDPDLEEIESMATYYGRLYISTSRPYGTGVYGRLFVTASVPDGRLVSQVHDFGTPTMDGALFWDDFRPGPENTTRFQVRSGETLEDLLENLLVGPDGSTTTFFETSGIPLDPVHRGHRYFQYAADMLCPDGMRVPLIESVTLEVDSLDLSAIGEKEDLARRQLPAGEGSVDMGPWLHLQRPCPNPARDNVDLRVSLEGAGSRFSLQQDPSAACQVRVTDLLGRVLRSQELSLSEAGTVCWRWDLRDEAGNPVPTGVYYATIVAPGRTSAPAQRMLVLR